MTSRVAFPYRLAPGGRTACASATDYLRQILEQIVFVEPGERVNRPDFGCKLRGFKFESGKGEVTAAVGALVEGALRQWAGDRIQIHGVDVEVKDARVEVTIAFLDSESRAVRRVTVSR